MYEIFRNVTVLKHFKDEIGQSKTLYLMSLKINIFYSSGVLEKDICNYK